MSPISSFCTTKSESSIQPQTMDNYRAWFRAKADTFKENYCSTPDDYVDLVLRQIEAFTSRTGGESPQELSRMIKHMEDTNTLYERQLDLLTKRYFAGKATFSSVSSSINESISVTNPNSDPNTRDSYQVNAFTEYSTTQPQQAIIPKRSDAKVAMPKYSDGGFLPLDSTLSDHQFVSLSPSNPNIAFQSTLSSPLVTAPVELEVELEHQPKPVFMGPSDTNSGSFVQMENPFPSVYSPIISQSTAPKASHDSLKRSLPSFASEINSIVSKRARGFHPEPQVKATHTCTTCGGSFARKSNLKRHQLTHSKTRTFACDQCDRVFTRKDHLTVHLGTHRRTVNARCTWNGCPFTSSKSSHVLRHIRTVHFKLPETVKQQAELGLTDHRNPYDYFQKI